MNPVNPGSRTALPPTFDSTSATYHDDLHKAGFISDAQLTAAKSGNKASVSKADDEVLTLATFAFHRPLTEIQSQVINSDFISSQRKRDEKLATTYRSKGFVFEKNRGEDHNCLIISILQHLTGDYKNEHTVQAKEYRNILNDKLTQNLSAAEKEAFPKNQMLAPDHLNLLLPEMAKDLTLNGKTPLAVEFWMANQEGEPVKFTLGDGKETVIIFQRADHFEAVNPPPQKNKGKSTTAFATTDATALAAPPVNATVDTQATTGNTNTVSSSADNSLNNSSDSKVDEIKDIFKFGPTEPDFFDDKIVKINLDKPDSLADATTL